MVIIKSKLTGKFLRQHSGSANSFTSKNRWKITKDEKFLSTLPPRGDRESDYGHYGPGTPTERQKKISREVHDRMYNAEAMEARRYATISSALTSIGKSKWLGVTLAEQKRLGGTRLQFVLPEHLEIHEIVAGNLCIVDVNDDEETKRRKEKECK